jgi:hypothetical protein
MLEVEQLDVSIPQGRPGTLSPAEEAKLRQLWHLMLRFSGIASTAQQIPNGTSSQSPALWRTTSGSDNTAEEKKKKSKLSFLGNHIQEESDHAPSTTASDVLSTSTFGTASA